MDAAQWPQDIVVVSSATTTTTTAMINAARPAAAAAQVMPMEGRRAIRAHKEQALNCPRCNSTNTKFCYYNNYSLTQPRYFCKTCRRYWTEGGSLRNVPVGGGSRKNKRSSSSTSIITNPNPNPNPNPTPKHDPTPLSSQNPKFHEGQDLNLAYPHHNLHEFADHFPNMEGNNNSNNSNNALSAMELIRSGRGLMSPFMAYPSGFSLQDHMRPPTLNFPLDGSNGGGGYGVSEGSGRLLFPFEDLKQVPSSSSTDQFEQNRGQGGDTPGFWNGLIGGGGSW